MSVNILLRKQEIKYVPRKLDCLKHRQAGILDGKMKSTAETVIATLASVTYLN